MIVKDFFNIKFKSKIYSFTQQDLIDIYNFAKELQEEYYYVAEEDEVTNKASSAPIKGIRPLRKFLLKVGYAQVGGAVEQTPDGVIHFPMFGTMTFEDFKNFNIPNSENDVPRIGVKDDKCDLCILHGECSKYCNNVVAVPYKGFCEEAKFNYHLFRGIADIEDTEERRAMFNTGTLNLA